MTPAWRAAAAGMLLAASAGAMESPRALQISPEQISRAADYSRRTGGQALIVMQSGRITHESYAQGGAPCRPTEIMSLTKNLAAVATFAAQADGLLDLDEPVAKTITEWSDHPVKRRITIRQLLSQTSGLASGFPVLYSRSVRDKNQRALDLPVIGEPGEQFTYGPANFEILAEVLRRKLAARGTDPRAFIDAKVLAPVGISASAWRRDRVGNAFLSAGAKMTARDVVKFGEFVRLRGRVWLVQVIPEREFLAAADGTSANAMYGLSFWLNRNADRAGVEPVSVENTLGDSRSPASWRASSLANAAPADLLAMIGSGGIRCYVVPSRKLVIVRFGTGRSFSDAEFLDRIFGAYR